MSVFKEAKVAVIPHLILIDISVLLLDGENLNGA